MDNAEKILDEDLEENSSYVIEVSDPVLTQEDLDLIIEQMVLMNENIELLNLKIVGELDEQGNIQEIPEEETELFKLQEIHDETINQNTLLTQIYDSETNQEPYRYDYIESSNGYLSRLNEQVETMNLTLGESADINFLAQSSILTYSTVFFPLVAIILSLWWFFKNFLNRIR